MLRRAAFAWWRTRDVSWALLGSVLALGACSGADDPPEQITDLEFSAFLDGDTAGDPVTVRLSDWFAENAPSTRILMINAAAGWCVPCMTEAAAMPDFVAEYEPQGVAILTAVFQDQNGDPAEPDFVRTWVDTFSLTIATLIDAEFQTGAWFDVNTMPANMFVDAESREILTIAHGTEVGDDPMKEYRELLDDYLAQ